MKVPDVTLECLDALELLLKKDPKERISLFDFLHHPWLQTHQKWRNRKIWNDCYSSSSADSLRSSIKSNDAGEEETKVVDDAASDDKNKTFGGLAGMTINKGDMKGMRQQSSECEIGSNSSPK